MRWERILLIAIAITIGIIAPVIASLTIEEAVVNMNGAEMKCTPTDIEGIHEINCRDDNEEVMYECYPKTPVEVVGRSVNDKVLEGK